MPAGTEVVARYDFEGNSDKDLPFDKGDILTILSQALDTNWYHAQHVDGRKGLIPANYVQRRSEVKLNSMPWFHGKITRDEAETLLQPSEVMTQPVETYGMLNQYFLLITIELGCQLFIIYLYTSYHSIIYCYTRF